MCSRTVCTHSSLHIQTIMHTDAHAYMHTCTVCYMVKLGFPAFGRRSTLYYRSQADAVFTRAASHNQIKSFSLWAENSWGPRRYAVVDMLILIWRYQFPGLNVAICVSAAALHLLYLSEARSLEASFRVELHGNSWYFSKLQWADCRFLIFTKLKFTTVQSGNSLMTSVTWKLLKALIWVAYFVIYLFCFLIFIHLVLTKQLFILQMNPVNPWVRKPVIRLCNILWWLHQALHHWLDYRGSGLLTHNLWPSICTYIASHFK